MSPLSPANGSYGAKTLAAAAAHGYAPGGPTSISPAPQTLALMPDSALSLRARIERLPQEEREERRSLFSDEEWNGWDLNAFPWQLEPRDPNWRVWVINASRGMGKTYTGMRWALSVLLNPEPRALPSKLVCLFPTHRHAESVFDTTLDVLDQAVFNPAIEVQHDMVSGVRGIRNSETEALMLFSRTYDIEIWRGSNATHLWADELTGQTKDWFMQIPSVEKYVFTGGRPPILPAGGYESRPGLPRA